MSTRMSRVRHLRGAIAFVLSVLVALGVSAAPAAAASPAAEDASRKVEAGLSEAFEARASQP
ncbi:hypothetical protein [Intrasporangium sp.]|uniref:hypothetical protein n=1 Tax=Intrasporangium sp. TaxID=1925024 RepID=UPI002939986E|nr:hypothetical protein [Intrasporangium sp.]MDV3222264.1 hypothetical protein [Intrasporangium sp.]